MPQPSIRTRRRVRPLAALRSFGSQAGSTDRALPPPASREPSRGPLRPSSEDWTRAPRSSARPGSASSTSGRCTVRVVLGDPPSSSALRRACTCSRWSRSPRLGTVSPALSQTAGSRPCHACNSCSLSHGFPTLPLAASLAAAPSRCPSDRAACSATAASSTRARPRLGLSEISRCAGVVERVEFSWLDRSVGGAASANFGNAREGGPRRDPGIERLRALSGRGDPDSEDGYGVSRLPNDLVHKPLRRGQLLRGQLSREGNQIGACARRRFD